MGCPRTTGDRLTEVILPGSVIDWVAPVVLPHCVVGGIENAVAVDVKNKRKRCEVRTH